MKKVLLYNWVQFDDTVGRGGGVTKYLYNIISRLYLDKDVQYYFLSSGQSYSFDGKLRIEETQNVFSPYIKSFQIVNSPIMSPACMAFDDINCYLNDETLGTVIYQFCKTHGHFDIIHFHNLEGLSLSVLRLKEKLPDTRFIYTAHNYYFACPQVNLWNGNEKNCYQYPLFPACINCRPRNSTKANKLIASIKRMLSLNDTARNTWWYKYLVYAGTTIRKATSSHRCDTDKEYLYFDFRNSNCTYINKYFDLFIAVSKRTADIAIDLGINPRLISVQYIGTTVAENLKVREYDQSTILTIGYLGYARKDKGFDFLLEVIQKLSMHPEAQRIKLIIAAKSENEKEYDKYLSKVNEFATYFLSVEYQNGYTKDEQFKLLQRINCGIVPVCWEDNLPQVAIELIAAGIPILVSEFGGAKELLTNPWYIFRDVTDCCEKLIKLTQNPKLLNLFFKQNPRLQRLDSHVNDLRRLYDLV